VKKPLYSARDRLYFSNAGSASCKKISSLAVCGASPARSLAIVRPATKKPLSEGADVAGLHNTWIATSDINLNLFRWTFHHVNGEPT
jgi:hypothetical protein